MDIKVTKRLEHVCLQHQLDLHSFGEKFRAVFSLPSMEYDYENETKWLTIDKDGINYNISKPYKDGTLQEWDDTTPRGCNIGIVISKHNEHIFVDDNQWVNHFVADACKKLAQNFNTTVYHHRSFIFGIDKSEYKNIAFTP